MITESRLSLCPFGILFIPVPLTFSESLLWVIIYFPPHFVVILRIPGGVTTEVCQPQGLFWQENYSIKKKKKKDFISLWFSIFSLYMSAKFLHPISSQMSG